MIKHLFQMIQFSISHFFALSLDVRQLVEMTYLSEDMQSAYSTTPAG